MDDSDLFKLLDISSTATDQEVKKAYRKKALECHPDKNDGPDAAELFGKLKKAAEILLDPEARASYERVIKAREERLKRDKTLDGARKKFKDDLEARERAYKDNVQVEIDEEAKLAAVIERLRKEGCRELERQNEELKRQIARERSNQASNQKSNVTDNGFQIKISWKDCPRTIPEDEILKTFSRFGTIETTVINEKKKRGIIEFRSRSAAEATLKASSLSDFKISPLFEVTSQESSKVSSSVPSANYENDVLERLKRKAAEMKSSG